MILASSCNSKSKVCQKNYEKMSLVSHRNIYLSFREVSCRTGKKNVSKEGKKKKFGMRLGFLYGRTIYPNYLLSVGASSKISFKSGAMIFLDACALPCL